MARACAARGRGGAGHGYRPVRGRCCCRRIEWRGSGRRAGGTRAAGDWCGDGRGDRQPSLRRGQRKDQIYRCLQISGKPGFARSKRLQHIPRGHLHSHGKRPGGLAVDRNQRGSFAPDAGDHTYQSETIGRAGPRSGQSGRLRPKETRDVCLARRSVACQHRRSRIRYGNCSRAAKAQTPVNSSACRQRPDQRGNKTQHPFLIHSRIMIEG